MVSSARVPWYNRPPRPFPAKRWLETRYPFRVSPSALARHGSHAAAPGRRLFPALVWREQQRLLRSKLHL